MRNQSFVQSTLTRKWFAGVLALGASFGSLDALASDLELQDCGGVLFQGEVSCEVLPTEECTTQCEPVAFEEVCAFRLTTTCESSCTATATVECQSGCQTTCVPECEAAAATEPPNCMGLCMSDCQQDCTTTCADAGQGHCRASCAHTCSRDCHARCDAAPEPVCADVCTTACSGSCEARANIDCQVSCQDERFVSCETDVVEECETSCDTTGGGIFCNGQICLTDDLEACADELQAELEIHVDVSFEAEAKVESSGWFNCSVAQSPRPRGSVPIEIFAFLAVFGWFATRPRAR